MYFLLEHGEFSIANISLLEGIRHEMILQGTISPRHIRENDLSREGQSSPRFSKPPELSHRTAIGWVVFGVFFVTLLGRGKPARYKGGPKNQL